MVDGQHACERVPWARGIAPGRKRTFVTATKQVVTREVGYAIVASESFETTGEIVFGEPGDMADARRRATPDSS